MVRSLVIRVKSTSRSVIFISDLIEQGEIELKNCPTADMIVDYFTKPLQGIVFIEFCGSIVNIRN